MYAFSRTLNIHTYNKKTKNIHPSTSISGIRNKKSATQSNAKEVKISEVKKGNLNKESKVKRSKVERTSTKKGLLTRRMKESSALQLQDKGHKLPEENNLWEYQGMPIVGHYALFTF